MKPQDDARPAADPKDAEETRLHGYLAEFETVDELLAGCAKVRDAGFTKWDAHTPFPVHGIEEAMGVRMTILPWLVLGGGLTGLAAALLMQWWMNGVDYPFLVSGKPYFSLPANIPICFELTVLFSALTAFFAVLGLNLLPQLHHPLFNSRRFRRFSDDRFFISIEGSDPRFHEARTAEFLGGLSSHPLETVRAEARAQPLPRILVHAVIVLVALSWLPLAYVARARVSTTESPRVHLIWDMDWQPKYKTQRANLFFADGRAMRPQVPGTLARGELVSPEEQPLLTGKDLDGKYLVTAPVAADAAVLARGREKFDIFCTPCHGIDGSGNGIVAIRAERLRQGTWVMPRSVHLEEVRVQPDGQLFETITQGVRTMPAYGPDLAPQDRWAVVLYLRALQRSQYADLEDAPPEHRQQLEAELGTR